MRGLAAVAAADRSSPVCRTDETETEFPMLHGESAVRKYIEFIFPKNKTNPSEFKIHLKYGFPLSPEIIIHHKKKEHGDEGTAGA